MPPIIERFQLHAVVDGLPEKVAEALDLESLSLDDISALNRLCRRCR